MTALLPELLTNNYRVQTREYNSAMEMESVDSEIKSPSENSRHRFRIEGQICHFLSPLYPNEASESVYGEFYIFDSAEATSQRLENHSDKRFMAEVIQRLNQMLRQVNPFAES